MSSPPTPHTIEEFLSQNARKDLLRFSTVGSVDDVTQRALTALGTLGIRANWK